MSHEKYTTEAFILREYEQGEHDLVYKIWTKDFGIIFVLARSVRKITSKLKMKLKVNDFCIITLIKGKELWRVTGIEEDILIKQKKNLCILSECIPRFLPIEKPHKKLFEKLKNILSYKDNNIEYKRFKLLIYYIVLVDTGYADAKMIGAKDILQYKDFSVAEIFTHFILNEKDIADHIIFVLKNSML